MKVGLLHTANERTFYPPKTGWMVGHTRHYHNHIYEPLLAEARYRCGDRGDM